MIARSLVVGVLLGTSGCINFDGEGGAADVFCLHNPTTCDPSAKTGGSGGGVGGVNVSTGTGGTGSSTFAAGKIYIWGTLDDHKCYLDAIAAIETPEVESTGFGCYDSGGTRFIRPTDGRLLYIASDETVRAFAAEPLKWDAANGSWSYPGDTLSNDDIVVDRVGECNDSIGVADFRIDPGSGAVHYLCTGGWNLPDGTPYPNDVDLIAVGSKGLRLVRHDFDYKLMTSGGSLVEITGLPLSASFTRRNVRSKGTGFHAVVRPYDSRAELWEISSSGAATRVGTYSAPPARVFSSYNGDILDEHGNLYGEASLTDASTMDVVVKQVLEPGTSEIVYSEEDADGENDWRDSKETFFVYAQSGLFTGP